MQATVLSATGYWPLYVLVLAIIGVMLALDLGVFHRRPHEVKFREAAAWSAVWVGLALAFNVGLYFWVTHQFPGQPELAKRLAGEFLTGYLVEKSLSVDNIFVIAVIFSYFAIPPAMQHRVLFYGIIGAVVFRAIFIGLGSWLMQYHWVMYVFGAFLVITGIKMFFQPEGERSPAENPIVRRMTGYFRVTPELHGKSFFVKKDGLVYVTPLFLALLVVEFTDVVFAVDSVPAIFAITSEPFIVFSSNMFAILGLRSMYFMLGGLLPMFRYLKYGLGFILVFVGLKMSVLNQLAGGKFPISWSLGIIAGTLVVAILASIFIKKPAVSLTTESPEA